MSTNRCRCGSRDIIYVVHRGRNKTVEMFCAKCLPVELAQEAGQDRDADSLPVKKEPTPV
ncbi:hypothetical protein JCM14469_12040 [Desulfatiferula olefinivorans]